MEGAAATCARPCLLVMLFVHDSDVSSGLHMFVACIAVMVMTTSIVNCSPVLPLTLSFEDNKRHGLGTFIYASGAMCTGPWHEDSMVAVGVHMSAKCRHGPDPRLVLFCVTLSLETLAKFPL